MQFQHELLLVTTEQDGRLTKATIEGTDSVLGEGFAILKPGDKPDPFVGIAIAMQRAAEDFARKCRKSTNAIRHQAGHYE